MCTYTLLSSSKNLKKIGGVGKGNLVSFDREKAYSTVSMLQNDKVGEKMKMSLTSTLCMDVRDVLFFCVIS